MESNGGNVNKYRFSLCSRRIFQSRIISAMKGSGYCLSPTGKYLFDTSLRITISVVWKPDQINFPK